MFPSLVIAAASRTVRQTNGWRASIKFLELMIRLVATPFKVLLQVLINRFRQALEAGGPEVLEVPEIVPGGPCLETPCRP